VPESFLGVRQASVSYGEGEARFPALRNVSVDFPRGKLTLILGHSGSGKTTLLSLLGCLLAPDTGSVFIGGHDVAHLGEQARTMIRQQNIGFVFQSFRLFRSLSAADNVAIAQDVIGRGDRDRARALLTEFGLEAKLHLKPNALSGGEKQRVAIARALIKDPAILLADEPTASLDSQSGHLISRILFKLAETQRRTVVVVSHDPRWQKFAHHIVVLRDGAVAEEGSPSGDKE
jgi:putative ABC transport system ATP-binding protein